MIQQRPFFAPQKALSAAKLERLPKYLPWVDVLRFVACFLVIVLHATPSAPAGLGHAGVALFFSISGFLISRNLLQGQELGLFYARRFLRIYPAYLATLLLFVLMVKAHALNDKEGGVLFLHNFQYYVTFTFQLSPDSLRLPLVIVWTLCVEELFYLFIPLVFLLRRREWIGVVFLGFICLLLLPQFVLLPDGTGTWYLFPLNLFFGVMLALLEPRARGSFPFIGLVTLALVIANGMEGWFHSFGPVSAALCAVTVWSFAACSGKLPKVLHPFRRMGQFSYGIYLLHYFCLSVVLRALVHWRGPALVVRLSVIVLTMGAAVGSAWWMEKLVEKPALRLVPVVRQKPALRYVLATIQVCLIPTGVLLALWERGRL